MTTEAVEVFPFQRLTDAGAEHRFQPGHQLGPLGGDAKQRRRQRRGNDFADQLLPATDERNIRENLDLLTEAALRDAVSGAPLQAAVRAQEVALKALAGQTARDEMRVLEHKARQLAQRCDMLEAQLRRAGLKVS